MQVLATAGHVDHGKSTLVRALTGIEPDRWAEERRRGMTIDLGFAWTTLPGGAEVAFVDVPGHERFVPTMLAGVGPVPAVVLVVAADDGWRPQSAEHLRALDAFGVRHGLLVVTRADLADPEPARRVALEQLAATGLAGIESVAVSATTGAGMDDLRAALARLVSTLPAHDDGARVRLWVDRVFTIRGAGTVVTGTLGQGRLAVGDPLVVAASGRKVRVRGLQTCGRSVQSVGGISRVAVNLRGADPADLARGDALVREDEWVVTDVLDVRMHTDRDLPDGAQWTLHAGSAAVPARWRPFPGGGGDAQVGRLRLEAPLPLTIGDRALLRDPSRHDLVVAVDVLDPDPPPLGRRGAAAARATSLAAATSLDAAEELRRRGIVSGATLRRLGVDASGIRPLVGDWYVDSATVARLAGALRTYVEQHRSTHPLEPGVSVTAARGALDLPDPALVAALVRPPLTLRGGLLTLAEDPGAPTALLAAVEKVRQDLAANPFTAPDAERLQEVGLGPKELAAAERLGMLLRLDKSVVLLPDAPERAVERLAGLPAPFTASAAKSALGTTRRTALPLFELMDRRGLTRRLPDGTRMVTAGELRESTPPEAVAATESAGGVARGGDDPRDVRGEVHRGAD